MLAAAVEPHSCSMIINTQLLGECACDKLLGAASVEVVPVLRLR